MSNLTDFIGGSGGVLFKDTMYELIDESVSWLCPDSGLYEIIVSGGGGSGATNEDYDGKNVYILGGASGNLSSDTFKLTGGQSYSVTIGAGGSGVNRVSSATNGNKGGTTSFDSLISAEGGDGGITDTFGTINTLSGFSYIFPLSQIAHSTGVMRFNNIQFKTLSDTTLLTGYTQYNNGAMTSYNGGSSILAEGGYSTYSNADDTSDTAKLRSLLGAGSGGRFNLTDTKLTSSWDGGDGFVLIRKVG